MPVTYKNGHTFITWNPNEVYFMRHELQSLNLHFLHPSTEKLFNLPKRGYPDATSESVKQIMKNTNVMRSMSWPQPCTNDVLRSHTIRENPV